MAPFCLYPPKALFVQSTKTGHYSLDYSTNSIQIQWIQDTLDNSVALIRSIKKSIVRLNAYHVFLSRVRFLLGGRHGDFKFLPPAGYAPCYEALLPKEKMRVEPVKEYKRDLEGVRDLLGTTEFLSQASFIPVPVDTSQVRLFCPCKFCKSFSIFL